MERPIKKMILVLAVIFLSGAVLCQSQKLMTFNIRYYNQGDQEDHWDNRKEGIIELIKYYEPSIFGIQEGLSNQVEYLDSCLREYSYIGIGREDGKKKGEYSAIFYNTKKYRVIEESTFWLSETPDRVSVGWDAALERICTYGLFEDLANGQRIWILNTHFDHRGNVARENSAELILSRVREINSDNLPLVLMGDLNLTPDAEPIQLLKNGLDDAMEISKKPLYGPSGTFNGFSDRMITSKLDYFFTQNLDVLSYAHIDDRLDNNRHISDHLPVLIEINFPNAGK